MLHETKMQHSKSTYAIMARDLQVKVCACHGEQVHLVLDKYQSPSIKDSERILRYSGTPKKFIITGPDQAQRQSGAELLKNESLKEAFSCFLMDEWKKDSHGGTCMKKQGESTGNRGATTSPMLT